MPCKLPGVVPIVTCSDCSSSPNNFNADNDLPMLTKPELHVCLEECRNTEPEPEPPFNPNLYDYARFVGQATITGNANDTINNYFDGLYMNRATGAIKTKWFRFENHLILGTAYAMQVRQGGGYYHRLSDYSCTDGTNTTDYQGKTHRTTWTPTVNYKPSLPGKPCYGIQQGSSDYKDGVPWRSRIEVSTTYFPFYYKPHIWLGGLTVDYRQYPPYPLLTKGEYFGVCIHCNDRYNNNGVLDEYPTARKAVIEGHWEFTNDVYNDIAEATWEGV